MPLWGAYLCLQLPALASAPGRFVVLSEFRCDLRPHPLGAPSIGGTLADGLETQDLVMPGQL